MEKETKSKLVDETMKYSTDEDVVALYFEKSKEELEYNTLLVEAKEAGIKQGIEQNKIETATNLKKLGVDIETISKATGLSKEEIEKL